MYKVVIKREKCKGHGHCARVAPGIWSMKNGKAVFVLDENASSISVNPADIEAAKKSALVCPEYAIDVTDGKDSVLNIDPGSGENVRVLTAHYDSAKEWVMDDRGFFTIKPFPEEGLIRVRYYNGKHKLSLVIEGRNAEEIYNTIVREKLVSRMDHAAYIGCELMKAEIAMKLNVKYEQDSPLEFHST